MPLDIPKRKMAKVSFCKLEGASPVHVHVKLVMPAAAILVAYVSAGYWYWPEFRTNFRENELLL